MAPHVLPLAGVVERLLGEEFARQAALVLREVEPILVHMGARHDAVSLAELYRLLSDRTHPEAILRRLFGQVDRETLKALERRVPTLAIPAVVSSGSQLAEQWIKRNANLIKVEPAIQRAIHKVLEEPLHQGVRVEAVKKRLQERFEIEERRAQLIARDQTLKLAGQLQEARQTQAGIKRYVWTTSDDERVRPDHAALDGTIQEWDNPPVVDKRTGRRAHPGGDYQCRCTADPVLDDDTPQIPEGAPAPEFTLPEVEPQLLQPEPDFTPAFTPPQPRQAPEPVPVVLQGALISGDAPLALRDAAFRGLADFAPARVPLAGFQVVGESGVLGEGVGGHYSLQRKTLTIGTSAKNLGNVAQGVDVARRSGLTPKLAAKPFGARYAGMLENVANVAATPAKAIEITTTHEYAHHLHLATLPKGGPAEMLIRRAYFGPDATGAEDFREASSWRGRQPVSAYGDANLAEFWAEAVAAYRHLPRAWLEEHAPATLAMVEAVLKLL